MAGLRGAADPRPAPPTRCAPQAPASGRSPSRCPSRCSPWPACPWCSTTSRRAPRYAGAGLSRAGPGAVQELPSHCAPAGARPEGDTVDGLLPAPRSPQPLPGGGPAGIQDSHQVGALPGAPLGPAFPSHPSQSACRKARLSLSPPSLTGTCRSTQLWARLGASTTSVTRSWQVVLMHSLSSTRTCAPSSPCRRCWTSDNSTGTRTALSSWAPRCVAGTGSGAAVAWAWLEAVG